MKQIFALVMTLACVSAGAQQLYRCHGPDGKTYSDAQCGPNGTLLEQDGKRGNTLRVKTPQTSQSRPLAPQERPSEMQAAAPVKRTGVNTASCDASGCTGTDGSNYKRTADGAFVRQDGVGCQRVGAQMVCN